MQQILFENNDKRKETEGSHNQIQASLVNTKTNEPFHLAILFNVENNSEFVDRWT